MFTPVKFYLNGGVPVGTRRCGGELAMRHVGDEPHTVSALLVRTAARISQTAIPWRDAARDGRSLRRRLRSRMRGGRLRLDAERTQRRRSGWGHS